MTLDESVHGMRLRVIERAQVLGNVSAVCRELGISRTLFYRWRKRLERYGVDGVHPRRQRGRAGRPVATPPEVERLALGIAISAATWRSRHGHTRHVEANEPGQLVCLDTFYIGNLKGVGKVWQITACDAATSYGLAGLLPAHDAAAAAAFLREIVVPHFQRAGWPVRRVLTDGGPEFNGAFDEACRQLGIRHTRTKPRHAWTNGFVERLQGTILQEHWRVAFRRRYFTNRAALQRALDGFMRYYNTERPHQGYRVRGRTPAALVWGVAAP